MLKTTLQPTAKTAWLYLYCKNYIIIHIASYWTNQLYLEQGVVNFLIHSIPNEKGGELKGKNDGGE